jgi:hypothetical protein
MNPIEQTQPNYIPPREGNEVKIELDRRRIELQNSFDRIHILLEQKKVTKDKTGLDYSDKQLIDEINTFYNIGSSILIPCNDFAAQEDQTDRDKYIKIYLENNLPENREITVLWGFNLFIQRLVRNANLSELGTKNNIKELNEDWI